MAYLCFLFLNVGLMVTYFALVRMPVPVIDPTLLTVVYSVSCVLVAYFFKSFVFMWTGAENFQYQSTYEGRLSDRLFMFNFFVFFLPLLNTAFDTSNPERYSALASLMFNQMLFK